MSSVEKYLTSHKNLMKEFGCDDDYLVKDASDFKWIIEENEEIYFLRYWEDENNSKSFVMVRKNNSPLIYSKDGYTIAIGIDCIKIGFLLNDKNKY